MMMDIRPIRTDADHEWALKEIERYFENEPSPGSPDGDRFDVLATLIEAYERAHFPIEAPAPIDVLRFYMEQNGLAQADLAQVLGSRPRASEVLAGRRDLSLTMIAAIRAAWGIPADLLVPQRIAA
ncbi:helix-turn-helix domain-containing protein [Gluconacetobacter azotocaptans]|nr:helix-turn-helix domain-containing protein [Gluconacetobacter azotocaptans]GBQ32294.1 putative transcription regulator [Gluconacetobacter azotocaptans DSM 13594]